MDTRPTHTGIGVSGAVLYFAVLGLTILGPVLQLYQPATLDLVPAVIGVAVGLFIGGAMIAYSCLPDKPFAQLALAMTLVSLGGLSIAALMSALFYIGWFTL